MFVYSNFKCCPLVCLILLFKFISKFEKIEKRCLRMLLNENADDYETSFAKTSKCSMETKRMRIAATQLLTEIKVS